MGRKRHQGCAGFVVVLAGAGGFVLHQLAEFRRIGLLPQGFFRILAGMKIFERKIDAVLCGIGAHVPENVGELERHAQIDGVVLRPGGRRPENMQADEPYDGRDTIAIR